jgi:hypothetical protein
MTVQGAHNFIRDNEVPSDPYTLDGFVEAFKSKTVYLDFFACFLWTVKRHVFNNDGSVIGIVEYLKYFLKVSISRNLASRTNQTLLWYLMVTGAVKSSLRRMND